MEEPIKIEETNPAKVSLQIFIDEVVELANRNGVTFVGGFIDKHDYGVYNNFTGEISDETLAGFQECIQELNNHIMVASFSN